MLPELGNFAAVLALALSILQLFYSIKRHTDLTKFFAISAWVFAFISFLSLVFCFAFDDFSVLYVALNSNSHLPMGYKVCALWGGHEGSILLWAFILHSWTLAVILFRKYLDENIFRTMLGVLSIISIGFLAFLLFTSNPFARAIEGAPIEGLDLNPLLQDLGFVVHPPLLYLGYVGTTVVFSFCIASLIVEKIDVVILKWIRGFALASFAFLTLGITIGSYWAYYELGWGGFWFWDPVENASFMPWLCLTAFIHILTLSTKRQGLYGWLLFLGILSFSFSLLGTFLVRSGVITSVHAFASDPTRGNYILLFLSLVIGASLLLYGFKALKLKKDITIKLFTKETFLLINSVFLLVIAFIILLGTVYPLIVEIFTSKNISVGPPYFNMVVVPIFVLLLFFMVPGTFIIWYKENYQLIRKILIILSFCCLSSVFILNIFAPFINIYAVIGISLGAFIIIGTLMSVKSNLAMVLSHIGIGVTVIGISVVSVYSIENNMKFEVGKSYNIAGSKLNFAEINLVDGPNYVSHKATFKVYKNNKALNYSEIFPEKRFFLAMENYMTETAIFSTLFKDIYIALGDDLGNNHWSCRVYYKPFVSWIWFGGVLMFIGVVLAYYNKRKLQKC